MNVFGLFPHMHKLGTKFEVTRTTASGDVPFLMVDPWQFGNQPVQAVSEMLTPTDQLAPHLSLGQPCERARHVRRELGRRDVLFRHVLLPVHRARRLHRLM